MSDKSSIPSKSNIPDIIRIGSLEFIEIDQIPPEIRDLALDYYKVYGSTVEGMHQFHLKVNAKTVFTKQFVESFYTDFLPFYKGLK